MPDIYLYGGEANPNDVRLRNPTAVSGNITVETGVGSLILTGFIALVSVSDNQVVSPGVGQLDLNGFAPTVSVSNNQTVSPGVGSLILDGFSPSVVIGVNVFADTGVLVLTGFPPTVVISGQPNPPTPQPQGGIGYIRRIVKPVEKNYDDDLIAIIKSFLENVEE